MISRRRFQHRTGTPQAHALPCPCPVTWSIPGASAPRPSPIASPPQFPIHPMMPVAPSPSPSQSTTTAKPCCLASPGSLVEHRQGSPSVQPSFVTRSLADPHCCCRAPSAARCDSRYFSLRRCTRDASRFNVHGLHHHSNASRPASTRQPMQKTYARTACGRLLARPDPPAVLVAVLVALAVAARTSDIPACTSSLIPDHHAGPLPSGSLCSQSSSFLRLDRQHQLGRTVQTLPPSGVTPARERQ